MPGSYFYLLILNINRNNNNFIAHIVFFKGIFARACIFVHQMLHIKLISKMISENLGWSKGRDETEVTEEGIYRGMLLNWFALHTYALTYISITA